MKISRFWGGTEGNELIENKSVLVERGPEDLGMDLFQLLQGFAGFEKR